MTLAGCLWFLPPPARGPFAKALEQAGFTVDPELATKRLVSQGPEWMGNHAPHTLEAIPGKAAEPSVEGVAAIARGLLGLPALRGTMRTTENVTPIATGLYELGVRAPIVPGADEVRLTLLKMAATNPTLAKLVTRVESASPSEREALGKQFKAGFEHDLAVLQNTDFDSLKDA